MQRRVTTAQKREHERGRTARGSQQLVAGQGRIDLPKESGQDQLHSPRLGVGPSILDQLVPLEYLIVSKYRERVPGRETHSSSDTLVRKQPQRLSLCASKLRLVEERSQGDLVEEERRNRLARVECGAVHDLFGLVRALFKFEAAARPTGKCGATRSQKSCRESLRKAALIDFALASNEED